MRRRGPGRARRGGAGTCVTCLPDPAGAALVTARQIAAALPVEVPELDAGQLAITRGLVTFVPVTNPLAHANALLIGVVLCRDTGTVQVIETGRCPVGLNLINLANLNDFNWRGLRPRALFSYGAAS